MDDTQPKTSAIRAARLRRKLTQSDVGKAVGATKATVSGWENGHYKPEPEKAMQLGKLLGLTLEKIYATQAA